MAFLRSSRLREAMASRTAIAESGRVADDTPPFLRDATGLLLDAIRGSYGTRVSKATALRVPAFARAYRLYTHTIACFPLEDYDAADVRTPRPFLAAPSPSTTYTSIMARTIGDLLCHDTAYWKVTGRDWQGFPSAVDHMPYEQVQTSPNTPADAVSTFPAGTVHWNGVPVPDRDVIRFDGDGTGGWLATGVDTILTAAQLEATVLRTAEVPAPSFILKNTGADIPTAQVDAVLQAWENARANRTTAYLNATLDAESLTGWSPNDLQLEGGRNVSAVQVARNANLDPVWVGAGVSGASLTYSNRVDLYRQLLDLSFGGPMRMVTDRLSMNDVTPRGHTVRFDTDVFLRGNTADLTSLVAQLVPLGVLTPEQGAVLLDLPVEGDV